MRTFSLLMLFGSLAFLSGCAEGDATTETPETPAAETTEGGEQANHADHDHDHDAHASESVAMNTNCPIMGSPVKPDGGSAEYNGKTVGFCCPGCVEKWTSLSEEDKAKKLAEANPTDENAGA